jgi:DNA-directed RNA polymerase specialized sigma24 family protein
MQGFRQFIMTDSEDAKVIQMYLHNPDMKIAEIAQLTGKSQAEIYRALHHNDITPNRLKQNSEKVVSLRGLGWGIDEIARVTGYTTRNVRYILAKRMNEEV